MLLSSFARNGIRNFATEKQILNRIKTTKNISKITKSMKMVSAAKLRGAQERMSHARPFNKWTDTVGDKSDVLDNFNFQAENYPERNLFLIITSDRGLCGGVNSQITRGMRTLSKKFNGAGKKMEFVVVGEKGRAQLRRFFPDFIRASLTEVAIPYTFDTALSIAHEVLKFETDAIHIIYNQYRSVISFNPSIKTLVPFDTETKDKLVEYEFEPGKSEAF